MRYLLIVPALILAAMATVAVQGQEKKKEQGPVKVIDLNGRFVTPGLADGHLHNEGGGRGIDLSGTRSLDDLFAVVGRAAASSYAAAKSFLAVNATATSGTRSHRAFRPGGERESSYHCRESATRSRCACSTS